MKFILLSCLLVVCFTEQSYSAPPKNQCYDKPTEHYWPVNTEYRPVGQCVSIKCTDKVERLALACPINAVSNDKCTRIPANLRKAYPDCCPTYQCPK